jgi:hypothetical protein
MPAGMISYTWSGTDLDFVVVREGLEPSTSAL